jgi:hypothetical protein
MYSAFDAIIAVIQVFHKQFDPPRSRQLNFVVYAPVVRFFMYLLVDVINFRLARITEIASDLMAFVQAIAISSQWRERITHVMRLRARNPITGPCAYCGRPLRHDVRRVACRHSFHESCLIAMALEGNNCCVCHQVLKRKGRHRTVADVAPEARPAESDPQVIDVADAVEEEPKQDGSGGQLVAELIEEVTTALRRVRQRAVELQNLIEVH